MPTQTTTTAYRGLSRPESVVSAAVGLETGGAAAAGAVPPPPPAAAAAAAAAADGNDRVAGEGGDDLVQDVRESAAQADGGMEGEGDGRGENNDGSNGNDDNPNNDNNIPNNAGNAVPPTAGAPRNGNINNGVGGIYFQQLMIAREDRGQCGGCSMQTYEIQRNCHAQEIGRTPLTTSMHGELVVFRGRCLMCNPMPTYYASLVSQASSQPSAAGVAAPAASGRPASNTNGTSSASIAPPSHHHHQQQQQQQQQNDIVAAATQGDRANAEPASQASKGQQQHGENTVGSADAAPGRSTVVVEAPNQPGATKDLVGATMQKGVKQHQQPKNVAASGQRDPAVTTAATKQKPPTSKDVAKPAVANKARDDADASSGNADTPTTTELSPVDSADVSPAGNGVVKRGVAKGGPLVHGKTQQSNPLASATSASAASKTSAVAALQSTRLESYRQLDNRGNSIGATSISAFAAKPGAISEKDSRAELADAPSKRKRRRPPNKKKSKRNDIQVESRDSSASQAAAADADADASRRKRAGPPKYSDVDNAEATATVTTSTAAAASEETVDSNVTNSPCRSALEGKKDIKNVEADEEKETSTSTKRGSRRTDNPEGETSVEDEAIIEKGEPPTKRRRPSTGSKSSDEAGIKAMMETEDKKNEAKLPVQRRKRRKSKLQSSAISIEDAIKEAIRVASTGKKRGECKAQMNYLKFMLKTCTSDERVAMVVKNGGVEVMLRAMQAFPTSVNLQTVACELLVSVIYYDEERLVIPFNIHHYVLKTMQTRNNAALHHQAIGVLQQLAGDICLKHELITKGCLNQVLISMKAFPSVLEVQDTACLFLQDLASEVPSYDDVESVLESGAHECVLAALKKHRNSARFLEAALGAIANMFFDEKIPKELKRKVMLDDGLIQILAVSMMSVFPETVYRTCNVLMNLCMEDFGVNQAIVDAELISKTAKAMQRFQSNERVQEAACIFLGNLSFGNVERGSKVASDGGSAAIIDCLKPFGKKADVMREVMSALRNVGHPSNRSASRTVSFILEAMESHKNDSEIQGHGCVLLHQYMQYRNVAKMLGEAQGQDAMSRAARKHPHACKVLVNEINEMLD